MCEVYNRISEIEETRLHLILLSSDIRSEGSIAIVKIFDFDFLSIFSFYITPRV